MRALLIAVFLLGCATPTPLPVTITPKHQPAPFRPTFHVIARGYPQTLKHPTWMRLCPIDGAVFICGSATLPWLRGTEVEIDPALQKGLSFDQTWIKAAYGSWPGNAWLRVAGLNAQHEFYRYHDGAWHLELTVSGEHSCLVPRPGGPLVITRETFDQKKISFAAPFGGAVPDDLPLDAVALLSDGDVAVSPEETFVLDAWRILRVGASITQLALPEDLFFYGLRRARGALVAFGERDGGAPVLQRFADERWSTMNTAGVSSGIHDYASDSRNEWVIADDKLHHRRDDEPFRVVDLAVKPLQVWSANDDDAWVVGTDGKEGVLLRTIPSTTITKL
jgi:hypothetical protein